jgi:hypothetical protein
MAYYFLKRVSHNLFIGHFYSFHFYKHIRETMISICAQSIYLRVESPGSKIIISSPNMLFHGHPGGGAISHCVTGPEHTTVLALSFMIFKRIFFLQN